MMLQGQYIWRIHTSLTAWSYPNLTSINWAMHVGGSCKDAIQSLQQAKCRCGMILEIQVMLKMREPLNTLEMCKGGWEKSYESGRTPFGNTISRCSWVRGQGSMQWYEQLMNSWDASQCCCDISLCSWYVNISQQWLNCSMTYFNIGAYSTQLRCDHKYTSA